eukprot:COSAG03_NODE_787_length_5862_cov_14.468680_4_plen_58_part_00
MAVEVDIRALKRGVCVRCAVVKVHDVAVWVALAAVPVEAVRGEEVRAQRGVAALRLL